MTGILLTYMYTYEDIYIANSAQVYAKFSFE